MAHPFKKQFWRGRGGISGPTQEQPRAVCPQMDGGHSSFFGGAGRRRAVCAAAAFVATPQDCHPSLITEAVKEMHTPVQRSCHTHSFQHPLHMGTAWQPSSYRRSHLMASHFCVRQRDTVLAALGHLEPQPDPQFNVRRMPLAGTSLQCESLSWARIEQLFFRLWHRGLVRNNWRGNADQPHQEEGVMLGVKHWDRWPEH